MFKGAFYEVGHVVQIRKVTPSTRPGVADDIRIGWVWVTEKTEEGGKGLGYGLAVGTLKDSPWEFTHKQVQRSCGPHSGKADFAMSLRDTANKYERSLTPQETAP